MRKALLFLVVLSAALSGAILPAVAPAGAVGVVDLGAAVTSSPATVSPAGGAVIYTADYTNEGLVAVEGTFTDATNNGSLIRAEAPGCSVPAVGTTNPTITCVATLQPGTSMRIRVVIQTPTTAPATVTNTASASVNPAPLQPADLNSVNDSATVTTQVTDSTGVGSAGFVQEGGTLRYKSHVLTVRDADLGVVAYLNDVPAPETAMCGPVTCKEGLRADYDQDPAFAGVVAIEVVFGKTTSKQCKGMSSSECNKLYFRKSATGAVSPVLPCGSQGPNDPCQESFHRCHDVNHYVVVMGTDDPDLLSPTKSLISNQGG